MSLLHHHTSCLHVQASQIQRRNFNNTPHMILPCVLLKEGVFTGSGGALLYTSDELKKTAHYWNGKPVLVDHPTGNRGGPVSANMPHFWEGSVLGQVFNAKFVEDRLVAELWLNESRVKRIAPQLHNKILQGADIEVSTGLFNIDELTQGTFNGRQYTIIARQITPDHLAILPNSRGACSWEDGCGIRSNESFAEMGRRIDSAMEYYTRKGVYVMNTETPLVMPTLEEVTDKTVTDNKTTTNTEKEYDMDIARLWRTK